MATAADIDFVHKTVLLVIAEPTVRDLIAHNLSRLGHYPVFAEGEAATRRLLGEIWPDAAVLDMDDESAHAVALARDLHRPTRGRRTAVVMLAREVRSSCGTNRIVCGADDCIGKPIVAGEVAHRVNRMFKRQPTGLAGIEGVYKYGDVVLDGDAHRVTVNGRVLPLSLVEHRMLQMFLSEPDKVHLRSEVVARVWGPLALTDDRTVDQNIRRLRVKLASAGAKGFIETVRGVGYRLIVLDVNPDLTAGDLAARNTAQTPT